MASVYAAVFISRSCAGLSHQPHSPPQRFGPRHSVTSPEMHCARPPFGSARVFPAFLRILWRHVRRRVFVPAVAAEAYRAELAAIVAQGRPTRTCDISWITIVDVPSDGGVSSSPVCCTNELRKSRPVGFHSRACCTRIWRRRAIGQRASSRSICFRLSDTARTSRAPGVLSKPDVRAGRRSSWWTAFLAALSFSRPLASRLFETTGAAVFRRPYPLLDALRMHFSTAAPAQRGRGGGASRSEAARASSSAARHRIRMLTAAAGAPSVRRSSATTCGRRFRSDHMRVWQWRAPAPRRARRSC